MTLNDYLKPYSDDGEVIVKFVSKGVPELIRGIKDSVIKTKTFNKHKRKSVLFTYVQNNILFIAV